MEQPPEQKRFVPSGVDAQSWMGFEQRIQDRRFQALLETAKASLTAKNQAGARAALDEARELRPSAPELDPLERRITGLSTGAEGPRGGRSQARAISAVALLVLGMSLVTGLDYLRSTAPSPATRVSPPLAIPVLAPPVATTEAAEVRLVPEPAARPIGTSGFDRPFEEERVVPETLRPASDSPGPLPPGEVPDDFVYPTAPRELMPRSSRSVPLSPLSTLNRGTAVTAPAALAPPVSTPVVPAPSAALPGMAPLPSSAGQDQRQVNDVLTAYARAYGQLDAGAARQVWPTVNERALARAFASLSSQDIAFDDCRIDVRGGTASADCSGRASYTGKVGSREPRTEARQWHFELRRDGAEWKIADAATR